MEFKLPELGEGVYEGEAVRWLVQAGDAVKPGQGLLEVLTDKATMEVPAPFAGVIDKLLVEAGDKIEVGQPILEYQGKGAAKEEKPKEPVAKEDKPAKPEKPAAKEEKKPASPAKQAPERDNGPIRKPGHAIAVKAAPSVRQMARSLGVDLAKVKGSGPDGRILVGDLAASPLAPRGRGAGGEGAVPQDFGKPGTRIKFAGIRRKIAEHMVEARHLVAHYAYVDECDVTDLVRLRASLKETFAERGAKLTYLAFFVKATVAALQAVPIVNASLDDGAGEIVLHDHYHIGIAVGAPAGLIVPVIHDADQLSLFEIAQEIERLSNEARTGKSRLEDLRGGTFTITSIGSLGGLFSAPIVNHPEAAILGLGKIVRRPVYDEHGQIKPADMLYLSFSFDHRVLDGAIGAAFGNAIIDQLQNPARLLL